MAGHSTFSPDRDERPIDRLLSPFQRFLRIEAAAGILLLACTVVALIWANSPWAASYDTFWHTYVSVGFGAHSLELSLAHFVNDGLMAIFFFVVGLEIKRELAVGELASPSKAAIPIAAAIGGMAVPALVYVVINLGGAGLHGWAIPMATDIAFAVGVMAMLGSRVPLSLKVFVTALAIVDDIGAVLVIALFYTSDISFAPIGLATGCLVLSAIANRAGVRKPLVYAIIGLCMWLMLLKSGVHATIGGVLLALTIPSKMRIRASAFVGFARSAIDEFERAGGTGDDILTNPRRQSVVRGLEEACEHVQAPLGRLEHGMHRWVAFVIMPIFALANAGVPLLGGGAEGADGAPDAVPIGLGIALGLLIGKPVGIVLATLIAVKSGLGQLPLGTTWKQIVGAGFLAGIGFTMSLFIANLAFADAETLQVAKLGILGGSLVAGAAGFVMLRTARGAA